MDTKMSWKDRFVFEQDASIHLVGVSLGVLGTVLGLLD